MSRISTWTRPVPEAKGAALLVMDNRNPPPPADTQPKARVRLRKAISKYCASPLGSAIFATCSVVGASIVSVGSGVILKQIAKFTELSLEEGYWATLSALSFSLIAILILWFRERGISDLTEDREANLRRQQALLEGRLVSMPPKDFIYEYIMALRFAGELRMQSKHELKMGKLTPEQVRGRIRSILSSVVVLTRLWDGVSRVRDHVDYKANLMNVVIPEQMWGDSSDTSSDAEPSEESNSGNKPAGSGHDDSSFGNEEPPAAAAQAHQGKDPAGDPHRSLFKPMQNEPHAYVLNTRSQRPAVDDSVEESWDAWALTSPFFLHCQSSDVLWERCTGAVAIVDAQLSVSSGSKTPGSHDDELKPIILPYTLMKHYAVGRHHPNLPGAPLAAATGQPGYIEDLGETIKNWLKKEAEVNPETTQKYLRSIDEYYKSLVDVSSLISIPVLINDKLNAVLNIQKTNESLLYNHERADMFIHLMNPICYHLGRMLLLMYTVDVDIVKQEESADEPNPNS